MQPLKRCIEGRDAISSRKVSFAMHSNKGVRALCTELHSDNLYRPMEVVLAEGLTVKHQYGRTSETEPNIRDCSTDNGRMRSLGSCSKVQKAKAGCSEISSEQGKLRMLMCHTLKFSSCSRVHHARSCTVMQGYPEQGVQGIQSGGAVSWQFK